MKIDFLEFLDFLGLFLVAVYFASAIWQAFN
jgi:hypothetical protein